MGTNPPDVDLTTLLRKMTGGGSDADEARERVCSAVYDDLHQQAHRLRKRFPGATLSTTEVLHDMFARLIKRERLQDLNCRRLFFWVAVDEMRRVLIDRIRRKKVPNVQFSEVDGIDDLVNDAQQRASCDLLDLDEALARLQERRPRQVKIVVLKFYGGLNHAQIADMLDVSTDTVKRDWSLARSFLGQILLSHSDDQ